MYVYNMIYRLSNGTVLISLKFATTRMIYTKMYVQRIGSTDGDIPTSPKRAWAA